MSLVSKLKKALEGDDAEEAVNKIIDDIKDPLVKKNEELLAETKDAKKELKSLTDRLDALEAEKSEAEENAAVKEGDIEKVKAQLEEKHKKEVDKLQAENEGLKGQLNNVVINDGLTAALIKANIAPQHMDAVKALIKTNYKGEIGDDDGKPFAKFDGKKVEEFVTDWAASDVGKHYVAADQNSGGGSSGANGSASGGNGSGKTMPRSEFDKLSPKEQSDFSLEGGQLVDDQQ